MKKTVRLKAKVKYELKAFVLHFLIKHTNQFQHFLTYLFHQRILVTKQCNTHEYNLGQRKALSKMLD